MTTRVRDGDTSLGADDVRTTTHPDGLVVREVPAAESAAFGFAATNTQSLLVTTPGGQTAERWVEPRTISRGNAGELLSLSETIGVKRGAFLHPPGTRTFTLNAPSPPFTAAPHRWRRASPEARVVDEWVDARGRLRARRVADVEPLRFEYDPAADSRP